MRLDLARTFCSGERDMPAAHLKSLVSPSLVIAMTVMAAGAGCGGGGASAGARTIRFPIAVSESHPRLVVARKFAANLERETAGRLRVQFFTGGELYGARESVRAAALGDAEMALEPETHYITFDQAFRALDIPFQFDTTEQFHAFVDTRLEPRVRPSLEKSGLTLLDCWDEGPMIVAGRSSLIRTPADFSGLKVRSSGHDLLARSWNELGAATINIPIQEVYTALQQGVAHAIFTTFNTFISGKTQEVAPKVVLWPVRSVYVWVVNRAFWEGLPEADRAIARRLADDATSEYNTLIWSNYDELAATVRSAPNGEFHELTPAEHEAFTTRLKPLLDGWRAEFAPVFADQPGGGS